jgi:hypothetical protein
MENFGFSAADLQFVKVDRILRATSPEHLIFILARPERHAYLVAARLAFEDMLEQLVPYPSRHFPNLRAIFPKRKKPKDAVA